MKSNFKKVLSVLLAVVLLASTGAAAAFAQVTGRLNVPTVYVTGYGTGIFNAEGKLIAPVDTPEGFLDEAFDACIRPFAKALISGDEADLAAYQDLLYSWLAPLYDEARLDNNGEPQPGQYSEMNLSVADANRMWNGTYAIRDYNFPYDWRLDPVQNAAYLNDFINRVTASTGFQKINLVGRCEGSTIVMAYLAQYGHSKVQKVFFNTPSYNGVLLASQLFSNHIKFDSRAIDYFLQNPEAAEIEIPEGELIEFLTAVVKMSAAAYGVDATAAVLAPAYSKMLQGVLPRILLASYATMPGMWAMVTNRDFDAAISYIFNGCEQEYAGLIAKIRYYRENVALKTNEIIDSCVADGVEFADFVKYGYPSIPLFEESMKLSDGASTVADVSFGATASDMGSSLGEKYANRKEAEGLGKYVSPDLLIDASTGKFRDTTWYVGNLSHPNFPDLIEDFICLFFNSDHMTVDSYAQYPQFLLYNKETDSVSPMTAENADQSVPVDTAPDFGGGFGTFFSMVQSFLARIIAFVKGIINGIIGHAKGLAG